MAIVQANQPIVRQEKDTMDRILQGVSLANSIIKGVEGVQNVMDRPEKKRQELEAMKRKADIENAQLEKLRAETGKLENGSQSSPAPAGYRWNQRGEQEMVVGGPAHQKFLDDEEKKAAAKQQTIRASKTVVQDIGRAIEAVTKPRTAGPFWGRAGSIPFLDTEAKDAVNHIKSAVSNIGFDQLNEMRKNSPTGGALGNVTELQLDQLNSVLGRLDITMRRDSLLENLKRVHNIYNDIVHGEGEGPERFALSFDEEGMSAGSGGLADITKPKPKTAGPSPAPQKQQNSGPQVGQNVDGYIFQGGDPANPSSWKKAQ